MSDYKILAFCVISLYEVLVLRDTTYEKACEKQIKAGGKIPKDNDGITEAAAGLAPGPNRLTEKQLRELFIHLKHGYLDYGVGALIIGKKKLSYYIMVPNEKEYSNHKAAYDENETALRIADNIRHTGSKRTRSGKNFDGGHNNH